MRLWDGRLARHASFLRASNSTTRTSFPRRRESRDSERVVAKEIGESGCERDLCSAIVTLVAHGRLAVYWIPACAGMTACWKVAFEALIRGCPTCTTAEG